MDMYMWSRESVWSGACTRVCPCVHVCVYVKESMAEMHLHGHKCVYVCLHRCFHMGVGWPGPGGMIARMQSLLYLSAWGGKWGLLLGPPGMVWDRATWGSGHTDCKDSRLWACPGPLRSTGGTG